jgi:four helix bundle protein
VTEYEKQDLKIRTKQFALQMIRLYTSLPKPTYAQVMGKQVFGSGTSVGAQYREAQRAKSDADFINKVEGSLQE